jgi:hypothetical protein
MVCRKKAEGSLPMRTLALACIALLFLAGLTCANVPATPLAPNIIVNSTVYGDTANEVQCTGTTFVGSACPISDDSGYLYTYSWYINGGTTPVYSALDNTSITYTDLGCGSSDSVTLEISACYSDDPGSCSPNSAPSNAVSCLSVYPTPSIPAAPIIAAASNPPGQLDEVNCTGMTDGSLCPATDGITEYNYTWYKNGAYDYSAFGGTSEFYNSTFGTPNLDCGPADNITLEINACVVAESSICSEDSAPSNPVTCGNAVLPLESQLNTSWTYIALAFLCALMILAIVYMASYVFSMPQLRAIVQDEFFQVIATAAVAVILVGTQGLVVDNLGVDNYLSAIAFGAHSAYGSSSSMMGDANSILYTQLINNNIGTSSDGSKSTVIGGLSSAVQYDSNQASKSGFCNFLGIGYVLANCASYNSYAGALTTPLILAYMSLADLFAQMFLLSLAYSYGFSVLIPLGLFLRCFKASRGAGGALIAIGFGFATVYPTVIVAMYDALGASGAAPDLSLLSGGSSSLTGATDCDVSQSDVDTVRGTYENYGNRLTNFGIVEQMANVILIQVIFMSILDLIITLAFIRMLAHAIGSEIDVSTLARIS